MDAYDFDRLVKYLPTTGSRRGVFGLLAALPVLGGLFALFDAEELDAKGRRKRRKKAHKHGKGRRRKHHKKKHKTCKPNSLAKTCAGKCGKVKNTCKKTVDCGPCTCDPPCGTCESCTDALVCEPCEPCCNDVCCSQANAICHTVTSACCVPDSKAQTCHNQCGDVVDNCGDSVNCGPCTCDEGCPACQVCDETDGECVADPSQAGDACGEDGQVCQGDGSCTCDATSCPACTTCESNGFCEACSGCCEGETCVDTCGDCQVCNGDGQCAGCPDCCDADGFCQDGDTDTACGSTGTCDVCTGQERCQHQSCICVPNCTGKVCGSDGCTGTCDPGCPPLSTCSADGTSCDCDFDRCGSTCCADGESCCGNDCADLQSDPDHCGDCGTTCGEGQVCQDGVCGFVCGSDFCPAATEICDAGTCQSCTVCASCTHTTVQAAIDMASSGDTIRICAGSYTRSGTARVARINGKNLILIGAGAGSTILEGGEVRTAEPVLSCIRTTSEVRQLTVTGANGGPGIFNFFPATLTLADVTVTGNTASGGITNHGSMTLHAGTSVTGNTAFAGGGIYNNGGEATLTLNAGVSVVGNTANARGGGIRNDVGAVTLNAGSSVTGNTAGSNGGGIFNSGTVTLNQGSDVSGNEAPPGNPNNCVNAGLGTGCPS